MLAKRSLSESTESKPNTTRFCIIIPAHNERAVISETLLSLCRQDYASDLVRCIVVADNCTDDTAKIVRATPSLFKIEAIERNDLEHRGKGFALNFALDHISGDSEIDAVIIIDADTQMDATFLREMDICYQACENGRGQFAAQGYYQVLNFRDSWRTALMAGALSLVHYIRPLAKERAHCSAGLKGNGMCFGYEIAQAVRWRTDSLTEDIDYTLDLIDYSHTRVRFVPNAIVRAEMPLSEDAAQSQRQRWEKGRSSIVQKRALPMLFSGIAKGHKAKVDIAFDLLCPPLAQMAAGTLLFAFISCLGVAFKMPFALFGVFGALFGIIGITAYVFCGFKIAGAPKEAYSSLKMAALYIPWKILSLVTSKTSKTWKKTERNADCEITEITSAANFSESAIESNGVHKNGVHNSDGSKNRTEVSSK